MHDPQYRLSVAWQNVGYNQPTQTGFYLGDGMAPPPRPAIVTEGFETRSLTSRSVHEPLLDGHLRRSAEFDDIGEPTHGA